MNYLRKNRVAFRPSVGDACLEDRLEMAILAGVPRTPSALVSTAQAGTGQQGTMSLQQIRQAFVQQFRAANRDLLQLIGNEITLAYRNGTPSAQQLADLNAQINGAVNATAFRLSSQAALLPNGSARLVPAIQNALLGSRTNGLLGRIQALTQSSRATSSIQSLQNAVGRQLNAVAQGNLNQLARFFNTTSLNRLSVDTTGNRIPLQQFLGRQVITQFGNTLGGLSQSFPPSPTRSCSPTARPPRPPRPRIRS